MSTRICCDAAPAAETPSPGHRLALARLCRALSDPTRLRLLKLLSDGEVCVCFFVAVLRTNQPKVSRHLSYLHKAGLVTTRRQGKWVYYRRLKLKESGFEAMLEGLMSELENDAQIAEDRRNLHRIQLESRDSPTGMISSVAAAA